MQASLRCEQPFPPVTWIAEAAGTAIEKPIKYALTMKKVPQRTSSLLGSTITAALWLALLTYFMCGALKGEVWLPSKGGRGLVIQGWAAWFACLIPILGWGVGRLPAAVGKSTKIAMLIAFVALVIIVSMSGKLP